MLKAFLDAQGKRYPKVHDLEMLLALCVELDPSFQSIDFVTNLTPYAVEVRYDEVVEVPREDIGDLVKKTVEACQFVISKISASVPSQ